MRFHPVTRLREVRVGEFFSFAPGGRVWQLQRFDAQGNGIYNFPNCGGPYGAAGETHVYEVRRLIDNELLPNILCGCGLCPACQRLEAGIRP